MPNTDAAFGLRPVQHLDGSPWNGKVNMYYIPSTYGTALFVGDPVISGGTSGAAGVVVNGIDVEGMATVSAPVAGSTLRGVIVGFLPLQTALETLHNPVSTARIALVCDAPDVVFEVQEDSDTSTIAAADVGENVDMITYAAGRTLTGRSLMEIDSSTHISTAAQFRILGLAKKPGNILGSFAKWLVVINEHEFKTAGGV
mgnify:CR=1 FL=1